MAVSYEWVVEQWDGDPTEWASSNADIIDQCHDARLVDVLRLVPAEIRAIVARDEVPAKAGDGTYWTVSLWRSTGDDVDGLRDRHEAYVEHLREGTFPGGLRIPQRYLDEFRRANV